MEKDIASLKSTIARLQGRPAPQQSPADRPAYREEEAPAAEPPRQVTETPPPAPEAREIVAAVEAYLVAEPVDPAWSRAAESDAESALRGEAMRGSAFLRADCRSTLCRVEVTHESDEARDRFVDVVPRTEPFHHGGFAYQVPDENGPRTVFFVAREGHTLPSVDHGDMPPPQE